MNKFHLCKTPENNLHGIICTKHGRYLYISLSREGKSFQITDCHYIDRSSYCVPKKLTTRLFPRKCLLEVIAGELDRIYSDVVFSKVIVSKEDLLCKFASTKKKNTLILLREGNLLKTRFKNRCRRDIYFEIELGSNKALIKTCQYRDKRAHGSTMAPYGLTTIYFDFSLEAVLNLVNNELEGGFTDVLISDEHSITLDQPICGAV